VARYQARFALVALAVSLLTTAAGCQFHKTGQGFIVRSQWALEYGDTNGAVAQDSFKSLAGVSPASTQQTEPAQIKPELLPWRSRLKGRLAASRFLRQAPTEDGKSLAKDATLAATDSRRWQPPPPAIRSPLLTPRDEQTPAISAKPVAKPVSLEIPDATTSLPESRRPDLVLD
jgi:hypothetical protein